MEFRVLSREFQSLDLPNEICPIRFAELLEENRIYSHEKIIIKFMLDKNLSNDKGLEVNVAVSQKKLVAKFLTRI